MAKQIPLNAANQVASISTTFTGTGGTNTGNLQMYANGGSGVSANIYMIGSTGNVGIDEPNPLAPLHVGTTANIIDTTTAR
jgi:hypothetical protein